MASERRPVTNEYNFMGWDAAAVFCGRSQPAISRLHELAAAAGTADVLMMSGSMVADPLRSGTMHEASRDSAAGVRGRLSDGRRADERRSYTMRAFDGE